MEIVALEYREADFDSPAVLGMRVAQVADACARKNLGAVGMARLLAGSAAPSQAAASPALLFGLRARSSEAAVAFGDAISARGYTGVVTWVGEGPTLDIPPSLWAGLGLVFAGGGAQVLVGASVEELEGRFGGDDDSLIWMPAPDKFERAVDGLLLEVARRQGVRLVWVPGGGINEVDVQSRSTEHLQVLTARVDRAEDSAPALARWAQGDRIERGRARVAEISQVPKRWFRGVIGWQGQ